jgi:hypothetical protein
MFGTITPHFGGAMAREQTVFSELTVAKAIGNCDISSIKNIDKDSINKYQTESTKRKTSDPQSEQELIKAGKKIRDWLINQKKLTYIKVIWTGMETGLNHGPVARDLLIDNTDIRISVKENAQLFQNPSPVKVFDKWPRGLFDKSRDGDWFLTVANKELNDYYQACGGQKLTGQKTVEDYYKNITGTDSSGSNRRKKLANHVKNLHDQNNSETLQAYKKLCIKVSEASANIFNTNLEKTFPIIKTGKFKAEDLIQLFSFFFKLDRSEHILCGTEDNTGFAVLIRSLADWEKQFSITNIIAIPLDAGQPEVLITFSFLDKTSNTKFDYSIQCQIRWSHGKFCGNPESKLYRYNSWSYTNLAWALQL